MPSSDSAEKSNLPEPSPRPGLSISVAAGVDQYELARPERIDAVRKAADKAYLGIIVSGGVYGLGLVVITALFGSGSPLFDPEFYVLVFMFSLVGMFVGSTIAFFTASVAHFIVLSFNWMMGGVLTRRTAVVLIGAIAGYRPTCFIVVGYISTWGLGPSFDMGSFLSCLLPVAMATAVGQIGGVIGASRGGTWRNLKHELSFNADNPKPVFQFKTNHLLKAMIWVSAFLALDQLFPNHELLAALAILAVLIPLTWSLDFLYFCTYKKNIMRSRK